MKCADCGWYPAANLWFPQLLISNYENVIPIFDKQVSMNHYSDLMS